MQLDADVDIDFANRDDALKCIKHIPASMLSDSKKQKHTTGIYITDIPVDPTTGNAAIDYKDAEQRGYFKVDFLNVSLYQQVKSEEHLLELMHTEPNWEKLRDKDFFDKLIHVNGHHHEMLRMPEPIDSIPRLAMFMALIRPGKKHLIGKPWAEVAKTVWDKTDEGYYFKKSHSVGYAHLVVVNMNLLQS